MFRALLSVTIAISSFIYYIILINFDYSKVTYSSVWCHYDKANNKFCTFKNVCFLPKNGGQFVFVLSKDSTVYGLTSKEDFKNISLTSVESHNGFKMKIVMSLEDDILRKSKSIRNPVVVISRFKSDNTMHVIHDDIFPLFMTFHFMCNGDVKKCTKTHRLAFLDNELGIGSHSEWYNLFSKESPLNLNTLKEAVCFTKLHTGLSRESSWFQYGFKKLQGPILDSSLNGLILRKFRSFILKGFSIAATNYYHPNKGVFISRKVNRKIINEKFVIDELFKMFSESSLNKNIFDIQVLDSMQNSPKSILETVQNCRVLVGMHGSAMIYSLFLPEGAAILELFPFGIQPQHVSPIRALTRLPDMKFLYQSWLNLQESNSIAPSQQQALLGGLGHLHPDQQLAIKAVKLIPAVECCHDPAYLYRMFQDTVVDSSITQSLLLLKNKQEQFSYSNSDINTSLFLKDKWFFPGSVHDIKCDFLQNNLINITWKTPLNIHPSIKHKYSITIKILTKVLSRTTLTTNVCILDQNAKVGNINVWIKCLFDNNSESIDSFFVC